MEFGLFSSEAIGADIGTPGFMDIQGVWSGSGNPDGDDVFDTLRDASLLNTIGSGALGDVYSYTTGGVAPSGNVVVFIREAGLGGRIQVDNVRLDATLIPEPSVLALLGIGLLLVARRRNG